MLWCHQIKVSETFPKPTNNMVVWESFGQIQRWIIEITKKTLNMELMASRGRSV